MKRMKKLISALLVLCLVMAMVPVTVHAADSGSCGDKLTWSLSDGVLTISGTGEMDSYAWVNPPWKDLKNSITSVVIKKGVTTIGNYAFSGCTNLTKVTFGSSLTTIGTNAFWNCRSLSTVTIPDNVKTIGYGAFSDCTSLTTVTLGNGITAIEGNAFENCTSLRKITIPDNVTTIGYNAFYECTALTEVTLGKNVTTIDDGVFSNCNSLMKVSFSSKVATIGESAFSHCTSLTEVTLPDSLTTIGSYAFYDCTGLTNVNFGKGLTTINVNAFWNCRSLNNVTIPDSVTTINSGAFSDCTSLTNVTLGKGLSTIERNVFESCTNLKKIAIPDNVTVIDYGAFSGCTNLTEVTLGKNLTHIGETAFSGCSSLTAISIPDSVVTIADDAFYKCRALSGLTLGKGLVSIERYAFAHCDSLTTVTIPDNVTTIEVGAFSACDNLSSVTIGRNVRTVDFWAFDDCKNLSEITFRGNAPYIDDSAFTEVTATVYYPANDPTWDSKVGQNYGGKLTWVAVEIPMDAPVIKGSNKASTGKISLTWEEVPGAVKYEVYRATSKTGKYSLMKTLTNTTYTNTSAKAGKYYYYYVRAIDAGGKYADSNIVGRTCDLAQTKVTLSNVASTGKIKVSWEAVEGATKYEVYRATSKNGSYSRISTTANTSVTNTKADAGKTYYYKVRAICDVDAAAAAYSEIKSCTCDLAQTKVTLSNVASTGKIKVSWEAVEGATKYEVYRATSKNGTYSRISTTSNTSVTNTKADAGKTYYYKVRAICDVDAAAAAYSEVKSCTCDLAQPSVSIALSSKKPKVSWGKVTGAVEYKVYRATSKTGTYSLVKTTTSSSYTDSKASSGKTYYYKVVAVCSNTAGNSAYSSVVSIKSK